MMRRKICTIFSIASLILFSNIGAAKQLTIATNDHHFSPDDEVNNTIKQPDNVSIQQVQQSSKTKSKRSHATQ